eukprot:TRINITY_DN4323_c0_g1_i1.p2 TRINITY_DN4323_c0_g1~~TRINITY_DN4323_c0_g1_i1.p2  ORF type:complete len:142 (-),score=9.07 TRINITY_DN4323_c0_g1_i1:357-782(-)
MRLRLTWADGGGDRDGANAAGSSFSHSLPPRALHKAPPWVPRSCGTALGAQLRHRLGCPAAAPPGVPRSPPVEQRVFQHLHPPAPPPAGCTLRVTIEMRAPVRAVLAGWYSGRCGGAEQEVFGKAVGARGREVCPPRRAPS